jgi:hypothetical protein
MNERATQRRLSGDPLKELAQSTRQGDYRYLGLTDADTYRSWVPGIPDRYLDAPVVWLVTDHTQTWTASAVRYFSKYNRALVHLRRARKLDGYGILPGGKSYQF